MTRSNEPLQSVGSPVLISVHPAHATDIAAGTKRVEFRRRWPSNQTDLAVVYATSPMKAIVAVVEIAEVSRVSKTQLWELSKQLGGGVTRSVLFDYMHGLRTGVALKLGRRIGFEPALMPETLAGSAVRPPQSFRYLTPKEAATLSRLMGDRRWR